MHRLRGRREDFEELAQLLGGESRPNWTCLPGYQAEGQVRLAGDRGSGCKNLHAAGIDTCDRGNVDYQLCWFSRELVDESLLRRHCGITDQVANEVYDGVAAAGRSLHVDDDRPGSLFVAIWSFIAISVSVHVTSHGNSRDLVKSTGGRV
jgi:hypothetical protein